MQRARSATFVAIVILIAAQIGLLFWPEPQPDLQASPEAWLLAPGQQLAWRLTMHRIHAAIFVGWSSLFLSLMLMGRYEKGLLKDKAVIFVPLIGLPLLMLILLLLF